MPDQPPVMTTKDLASVLQAAGWIQPDEQLNQRQMGRRLKQYQLWWGLKADGLAGPVTERSLKAERFCGHPDRMMLGGEVCRWDRDLVEHPLRWFIANDLPGVSRAGYVQAINAAFEMWTPHSNIAHEQVTRRRSADLVLTAGRIDGPSRTLAWMELPCGRDGQRQGRVDAHEPWVISLRPPQNRISLIIVMAHEIGHLWGLEHTSTPNQLMNPVYNPRVPRPQSEWDIPQVQQRHGKKDVVEPEDPDVLFAVHSDGTITANGRRGKIVLE